eukprot:TRINITY_DN9986_c0_g2_i3.p1 TRINITY_DN9986_c0_g2~~TRINITY_DN9986_c0_g2_i3.p1  ORF type:complete len:249 (+),score=60.98 TRINITY_DN9986_c0_g2_i3:90-836(+)
MPSLVGSEMCIRDSINAEYMGRIIQQKITLNKMRSAVVLLVILSLAALSSAGSLRATLKGNNTQDCIDHFQSLIETIQGGLDTQDFLDLILNLAVNIQQSFTSCNTRAQEVFNAYNLSLTDNMTINCESVLSDLPLVGETWYTQEWKGLNRQNISGEYLSRTAGATRYLTAFCVGISINWERTARNAATKLGLNEECTRYMNQLVQDLVQIVREPLNIEHNIFLIYEIGQELQNISECVATQTQSFEI